MARKSKRQQIQPFVESNVDYHNPEFLPPDKVEELCTEHGWFHPGDEVRVTTERYQGETFTFKGVCVHPNKPDAPWAELYGKRTGFVDVIPMEVIPTNSRVTRAGTVVAGRKTPKADRSPKVRGRQYEVLPGTVASRKEVEAALKEHGTVAVPKGRRPAVILKAARALGLKVKIDRQDDRIVGTVVK